MSAGAAGKKKPSATDSTIRSIGRGRPESRFRTGVDSGTESGVRSEGCLENDRKSFEMCVRSLRTQQRAESQCQQKPVASGFLEARIPLVNGQLSEVVPCQIFTSWRALKS